VSEMQDAVQVIRVTYEGLEMFFKVGSGGYRALKDMAGMLKKLLDQEKLEGRTSVRQLLKKGGDLQVFSFDTGDMSKVKELLKKHGVLYAMLPDLNKKDGKSEILFHSEAAPRIKAIIELLNAGKIETMEDYLDHADKEELQEFIKSENQKKKEHDFKAFDFYAVGMYFAQNPQGSFQGAKEKLSMSEEELEPIVNHMKKTGLLDEEKKTGKLLFSMQPKDFKEYFFSDVWKEELYLDQTEETPDKTEIRKRYQEEKKKNPKVNGITIDRKLFYEETPEALKTRIPGRMHEFLWIPKADSTLLNGGKTVYTDLYKDKEYQIVDENNQEKYRISGEELYTRHYDSVSRKREEEQRRAIQKQKVQEKKRKKKISEPKRGGR
jgi:hypothetical protein